MSLFSIPYFRCGAEWDKTPSKDLTGERLSLSVKTEDTVNVNVTNTLLELYHMVKNNWTLDYYNRDRFVFISVLYYVA